ncbi:LIM domain-containing protein WLIM2b [Ranunculus cassubicifolius]
MKVGASSSLSGSSSSHSSCDRWRWWLNGGDVELKATNYGRFDSLGRKGYVGIHVQSNACLSNYSSMEGTRSPSKAAGMFSGTQEKCATCGKTAYPLEKVTVENQAYHKTCFKCSYGGCSLSPSNYAALDGVLYCKHHFSQLFKEKGSYNHLLVKSASMRRGPATVPES